VTRHRQHHWTMPPSEQERRSYFLVCTRRPTGPVTTTTMTRRHRRLKVSRVDRRALELKICCARRRRDPRCLSCDNWLKHAPHSNRVLPQTLRMGLIVRRRRLPMNRSKTLSLIRSKNRNNPRPQPCLPSRLDGGSSRPPRRAPATARPMQVAISRENPPPS